MTGHECCTGDYNRGVGAGPATAGPKFSEPTIKNINILLFVFKQIRNLYITAPKEQDINFLQAKAKAKSSLQIRRS